MHPVGCGFFFPLSSSWITEEVATLVFWLYNGTVLCFVVVVVFISRGVENYVCLASWVMQRTIFCEVSCWISRFIRYLYICSKLVKYLPFLAVILPLREYLAHCLKLIKSIVVHRNLVLIVLFNGEISFIPSMSYLGLWPHFRALEFSPLPTLVSYQSTSFRPSH